MAIIRDQSCLFVCLVAACGGARDASSLAFLERDRALTAATADSPGQAEIVCANKVVFFGRSGAPAGASIVATTFDSRRVPRTCTGPVLKDQTWSCQQTLADGGYTWTAQVASGGPVSQQVDFVVSTGRYAAPTIDHTPSPNSDPKPILTGTVSPQLVNRGFYLEVTENGQAICIVSPIRSTNWACPLTDRLVDGPHVLSVDVDESDGDEATPWGNSNAFRVKTSIANPTLAAIPTPTINTRIAFSGTGEPDAVITVAQDTTALCQATVSAGGAWACMPPQPLGDGPHGIAVTQQDAAGNVSGAVRISFVIDTHMPAAPTLQAPASPTDNPQITFRGSGEAGATVSVIDSYSRLLCSAPASASGAWSCAPASPVADGDYLLTAFQVTQVGNRSGPSAAVPLSVRTLKTPVFDVPSSPTRDTSPMLTGHAQAGATVSIYLGEVALCTAAADSSGTWRCKPSALADDAYLLQAVVTDPLSHLSNPSAARALVIDTTAPAAPVLDQPSSRTRKREPTLSGTAEALSSVAVIDARTGEPVCAATATAAGSFACAPGAELALGEHSVTATATDAAGNASLQALPVAFTVTDASPSAPTIESPADGTELEQRRPVISGHTQPGTLVEISLDGASYVAQVTQEGRWTLLPPADLAFGSHQLTALATDPEQNVSDPAASRFAIVETGFGRGGCATGGTPAPLLAVVVLLFAARLRKGDTIPGCPRIVVAALALAVPSTSRAQNVDVSLFRPAAGGDGFAAVEGARPPVEGDPRFELRTWTDYAVHPLTFVTASGTERPVIRDRAAQWLDAQVHLIGPLSFAAQVPVTVSERGDLSQLPPSSRGPSELLSGFADVRLTPRLALLRQEWAGIDLATQMSFEFPTARAQTLSSDGRVRVEALVSIGHSLAGVPAGNLDLLANAYVRARPAREFLEVKSGSEAGLRAGVGYGIASLRAWIPRRIYLELEGRSFLRAGFAAGSAPAEWRLGGTICPAGKLAIDVAGGSALTDGVGAPRARFLLGVGWSPAACSRSYPSAQLASAAPPIEAPRPPPPEPVPPTIEQALPLPPRPAPPDRDGDGIPDDDDACPDQPGIAENHGCPQGIRQRVVVSATSLEILDQVHFATGQARIERKSWWLLDQVAAVLESHPDLLLIEVEGHTDDRGPSSFNILLSQARAQAVTDYLVGRGVHRERLVPRGFGPTRPIASNGTAEGRAANRRVAFTVVKTRARVIEAEKPPDS
jgi:outer membrane protein OmpA-like peptidoglycan-associated protein